MRKKAFALIYVLLFTVLVGVTVFTLWASNVSDLLNTRRNESSVEAQQLAKSAIDDAWVRYKTVLGQNDEALVNTNIPNSGASCPNVLRINPNLPSTDPDYERTLAETVNVENNESKLGVYDLKVCNGKITGVGYYKGDKITLEATIDHLLDTEIIGCPSDLSLCQPVGICPGPCDPLVNPSCTICAQGPTGKWDHSKDKVNFYQSF